MLRHLPQPLHPGGFEPDAAVQAPRDGLVDQCLPLLLQQRDEPLLGLDVALDLLVGVVEVPDDGLSVPTTVGWEDESGLDSVVS